MVQSKIAIIGIGNRFRQDDAVGIQVAEFLKPKLPEEIPIYTEIQSDLDLLEAWEGVNQTILVDAVSTGSEPGTVFRLTEGDLAKWTEKDWVLRCSTHGFNLIQTIELGRVLNKLPAQITVYGIEVANTDYGTGCSQLVEEAVPQVSKQILNELNLE